MKRLAAFTLPALAAATLAAAWAAPAQAANSITVNWKNDTGTSITVNSPSTCTPSGTCTYPTSISSGATGQIKQQASSTAFIRQIIFKYRYYDSSEHTYKSCQVSAWTMKSGGVCDEIDPTFLQTDGTAYSPTCTLESVVQDTPYCDFIINVKMNN